MPFVLTLLVIGAIIALVVYFPGMEMNTFLWIVGASVVFIFIFFKYVITPGDDLDPGTGGVSILTSLLQSKVLYAIIILIGVYFLLDYVFGWNPVTATTDAVSTWWDGLW